ncbi:MAG: HNH endonuclease signature motif containing protein [Bdellovibrionota bacterium]|mgnify:CR=1 FL=1
MRELSLNSYTKEVSISYRGEQYFVRNNGAICRQPVVGQSKRKFDNIWTFGRQCRTNGYMRFNGEVVHKIVASAFHGEQPSAGHVVDHLDTNRSNNRAENLRWVTRLENLTANPKTLRAINKKWGSVEGMLNDPNRSEVVVPLRNRSWMPQFSLENLVTNSLTPLAKQQNWKTPNAFPLCPGEESVHPLWEYFSLLQPGALFSHNKYSENIVEIAQLSDDGSSISVVTKIIDGVKDFGLVTVTFERGQFIHKAQGTFFTIEGATKRHFEMIGKLSDGGERQPVIQDEVVFFL